MTVFDFRLVCGPEPDLQADEVIDELYEAGFADSTIASGDGVQIIDVHRDAPTLADALLSAITALRAVADVAILRVEPDELVTMAEIARRTGRTRESVRLLVTGARGPGGFPAPAAETDERYRLWRWADVAEWLSRRLGASADDLGGASDHRVIAAVNGKLTWERYHDHVSPDLESALTAPRARGRDGA